MTNTVAPRHHYLNDGYGIRSWLLTRDHKRIALLYLAGVTFFFFVGGAFAVLIRLELVTPADVIGLKDGMQRYGLLMTPEGTIRDDFMFSRLAGEAGALLVVDSTLA